MDKKIEDSPIKESFKLFEKLAELNSELKILENIRAYCKKYIKKTKK